MIYIKYELIHAQEGVQEYRSTVHGGGTCSNQPLHDTELSSDRAPTQAQKIEDEMADSIRGLAHDDDAGIIDAVEGVLAKYKLSPGCIVLQLNSRVNCVPEHISS